MNTITEREHEMLDYIILFKQTNGYSPTIREIATGINTRSTSHIKEMLDDLEEKQYLKYKHNSPRTIQVLKFH